MANLIIAILAIALVSAIAVIGISYGGSIFSESQAEGQAAEIVAQATKVAGAMRAWANASASTTFADTNWSDGTATDLTTSGNVYLDALPQLGSYAQGLGGASDYYFKAMPIANVSTSSPNNEGTGFDSLIAVITSTPVCKAIARMSRGDSATPLARTGISGATLGDFSTLMTNSEFDCAYNDSNSNGTLDSGESMFFIYKVL